MTKIANQQSASAFSGQESAGVSSLRRLARWILAFSVIIPSITLSRAETVHITIANGAGSGHGFSPSAQTIFVGDTVEWDWVSGQHSSTSNGLSTGVWDSGIWNTGSPAHTYSYTFTLPGVYSYGCSVHGTESGTVTVVKKWPVGFYSLTDASDSTGGRSIPSTEPLLSADYVNGFRLRLAIKDIQPDRIGYTDAQNAANFIWDDIDDALTQVKAASPAKTLGVSIAWGRFCPDWLFNLGAYKFNLDPSDNSLGNGANFYEPLPWDTTFQSYLFNFIDNFAAKYDHEPAIEYVVLTGFQQLVENRLINDVDESVSITDATLTNVGTKCKVDSATAHFITRTGGGGSSGIIGKPISDTAHYYFSNDNAVVASSPAPTDSTVYLTKNAQNIGSGLSNVSVNILTWLPGTGDQYKVNLQAIAAGYSDTSPSNSSVTLFCKQGWSPYSTSGFACVNAYVSGITATLDYWALKFPHTPLILTAASPFADTVFPANWNTKLAAAIKQHVNTNNYPLGGYMTASLYSVCSGDYTGPAPKPQTPKGDQMIASLGSPNVYSGPCANGSPTPAPTSTQRVIDATDAALMHSDSWLEVNHGDMNTSSWVTTWEMEQPYLAAPTPTPSATPTCP